MGTNWTIEVKGSGLKQFLWCRFDGFPQPVLRFVRFCYHQLEEKEKTGFMFAPRAGYMALLLIRGNVKDGIGSVEGFVDEEETRHVIVDVEKETVELKGYWHDPFFPPGKDEHEVKAGMYLLTGAET